MLAADAEALKVRMLSRSLEIRSKELDFFTDSLTNMGTQAALIAGFAFTGIAQASHTRDLPVLEASFYFLSSLTFCFSLVVVCLTTFVTIWGPNLALRGPPGSVMIAVEATWAEAVKIEASFSMSVVCMFAATVCLLWLMTDLESAAVATSVVACFALYLLHFRYRLNRRQQGVGRSAEVQDMIAELQAYEEDEKPRYLQAELLAAEARQPPGAYGLYTQASKRGGDTSSSFFSPSSHSLGGVVEEKEGGEPAASYYTLY